MCKKLIILATFCFMLSLVLAGSAQAADPDLVAHWKLDDGAGTTAIDSSGNGNDGTFVGNPQWAAGKLGGALDFDGNNEYVDCGNDEIFGITDAFSLTVWINWRTPTVSWQTVIAKGDNTWRIARGDTTQTMDFGFDDGSRGWAAARTVSSVPLNEWHHVAATIDKVEGAKIYLDGILEGTNPDKGGISTGGTNYPVYIGENSQATGRYWVGLIDDVRVYKRVLTKGEIQAVMAGAGADYPFASSPSPADGAIHADTWVTLSWRAGDYAVSHDVYLGDNFDDVYDGAGDTFRGNQATTFYIAGFPGFAYPEGLVPGTTYYWRIDEVNDANIASPWKGEVWSFSIPCKTTDCNTITIGTGTSTWNYPMYPDYEDSRTQVIYLASEIGRSGRIKALALDIEKRPQQSMYDWTIRMKHTSMNAYSTALLENTGWTYVYQNNEYIYSTGWRTFEFQNPFDYNGTDNLLVDFSYNNDFILGNGLCRASTPGGTRSAYAYSDSRHGDPLNWVGSTSPDVYGGDYVPNIRLTICCPPPKPPVDFQTEVFTSSADPFDLEFTSVTFTPTDGGNSYGGWLRNITALPTNPSGGTNLGLGDDNWVRVGLSNQARVRIFNQSFSAIYVGSNGYITFTRGDTDHSETLAEHFELLRISGLYTDLTADNTGSVTSKQLGNRVAITWQGVPELNNGGSNTFQIEMFYDGQIRLSWLEIGSRSNIVGLSNGQGLSPDFKETDFSVQYLP